ncbi:hypothetical protein MFFC18_48280 [Mariniblastus fucicola]|uniref:Uncharacterized protein n=2 Tax=Mariniblastus fucicola TaxID=980251 RepID=A0A5B9PI02_9BACT|nr:hypothetical protein MFFC18_48280 [Mariniblastus fucicola]
MHHDRYFGAAGFVMQSIYVVILLTIVGSPVLVILFAPLQLSVKRAHGRHRFFAVAISFLVWALVLSLLRIANVSVADFLVD